MRSRVFTIEYREGYTDVTVQAIRLSNGDDFLRLSYWDSEGDYQHEEFQIDRAEVLAGLLNDISEETVGKWFEAMEPKLFNVPASDD